MEVTHQQNAQVDLEEWAWWQIYNVNLKQDNKDQNQ